MCNQLFDHRPLVLIRYKILALDIMQVNASRLHVHVHVEEDFRYKVNVLTNVKSRAISIIVNFLSINSYLIFCYLRLNKTCIVTICSLIIAQVCHGSALLF